MYNDAGVTSSREGLIRHVGEDTNTCSTSPSLVCTHTRRVTDRYGTAETIGAFAENQIYAGITRTPRDIDLFDQASPLEGNMANVDFGHYLAGGGGNPIPFLETSTAASPAST